MVEDSPSLLDPQEVHGDESQDEILEPNRQQNTHSPRHQGQDDAFHQKLTSEPTPPRAERRSDGELRGSGGASSHEEAGHIAAGDEEDQDDGP